MLDTKQLKMIQGYFKTQPINAAYLFGSQATGKTTNQSDVDVAVLFDETVEIKNRFNLRLKLISDLMGILKRDDIEVVDLEKAPMILRYEALRLKKYLYIKNNTQRALFEADTMSRYYDAIYYLKQNTQHGMHAFARGN